jgi:hypothetical protein
MTPERIAEITAAENGARPGPWTLRDALEGDGFPGNLWVVGTNPDDEDDAHDVVVSVGDRGVGAFIEMARTAVPELLAEIGRLTRQRNAATASCDRVAARAIYLRADRDQARTHLRRLVDHQDDPCHFDHRGTCQAHSVDGSEPGKCGVVEARQFLAEEAKS